MIDAGAHRASTRALLESLLRAGLDRVHAGRALHRAFTAGDRGHVDVTEAIAGTGEGVSRLWLLGTPLAGESRLFVIAAGKAACAMAASLESIAAPRIERGLAVTKRGHALPLTRFAIRETSHPVPDAGCAAAGREALALAAAARSSDVLLVLLSGGASALLSTPPDQITPDDLARTNALLLGCGADIDQMNTVRKHLSVISGGRLALATKAARVVVLAISDVPGDRLDVIGSGPCAPDPTTFVDAIEVVRRFEIVREIPTSVREWLEAGAAGHVAESPGPGDPRLARVEHAILARNLDALEAMREVAIRLGLQPRVLDGGLYGEAREAAGRLLAEAGLIPASGRGAGLLLAGGETTVRLRGDGRGGRNQELALAASIGMAGRLDFALLAAGTDGTDGPTDAAGAFADGETVARGAACGVDARAALERNDAGGFFSAEGGLIRTGPTHTNVMDVALLLAGNLPNDARIFLPEPRPSM